MCIICQFTSELYFDKREKIVSINSLKKIQKKNKTIKLLCIVFQVHFVCLINVNCVSSSFVDKHKTRERKNEKT